MQDESLCVRGLLCVLVKCCCVAVCVSCFLESQVNGVKGVGDGEEVVELINLFISIILHYTV